MGEKYAFSSMLHLVWAVVLVLGMGFVHFYMSMIATSFDPCPDEEIDANLKASIDKSTKYFNDVKMIHLGIAGAIILTMLIGKAIVPSNGKNVCSIITIVLKLAACLIVVFGVSHAQNILKIRNHQCKNKIDESKVRELKILIEACIGSIGVIIGNYLSLGINNLISFKMESSMSIIITMIICVLLVVSIIGGDALINIFKKEMKIKNECLALDEVLSNANVQLGAVGGVFKDFMPNKLEALPTSKTTSVTTDFNAGKTVMGGKPVITTVGETYKSATFRDIKIKFTEALTIPEGHSIKVTFPKEFNVPTNDVKLDNTPITPSGRSITVLGTVSDDTPIAIDDEYTLSGIKLPIVTGITQPIKIEVMNGTDVVSVSNNNFFDIKDDNTITIDSSKKMSKIFVRTTGKDLGNGVILKITNDTDQKDVRLPFFEGNKSINMKKDVGHSSTAGAELKREDYNHYSIQRIPRTNTPVQVVSTSNVAIAENIPTSQDGYVLEAGDRILLTGQTTKEQNGIYEVGTVVEKTEVSLEYAGLTQVTPQGDFQPDIVKIEEGTANKGKFFVKESVNTYKDDGKYSVEPNIFKLKMDNTDMTLTDTKFYYFELPLELVDSSKALKIAQFKLEIGEISTEGEFTNSPGTDKAKVFTGSYTLGNLTLTTTTTEVIGQQIACPVLSRDLFMKIFLTSVMTGWAVSSIVYLSGDLYEYNSSNIALMMGGGGGTGEVVVNVNKPEA